MSGFSIIIPTYNRAELLRMALESVQHLFVPRSWKAEILVIDNNSIDLHGRSSTRGQGGPLPLEKIWVLPKFLGVILVAMPLPNRLQKFLNHEKMNYTRAMFAWPRSAARRHTLHNLRNVSLNAARSGIGSGETG